MKTIFFKEKEQRTKYILPFIMTRVFNLSSSIICEHVEKDKGGNMKFPLKQLGGSLECYLSLQLYKTQYKNGNQSKSKMHAQTHALFLRRGPVVKQSSDSDRLSGCEVGCGAGC